MKVLIVNTIPNGGAANACINLHKGLLAEGSHSKLLFLDEPKFDLPESESFLRWEREGEGSFGRLKRKITEKVFYIRKNRKSKKLPSAFFNGPRSHYDVTSHPFYEEADLINLHWTGRFLDWPSFFRKNKKPVFWTLHDMNPFTGGYHYELGFPMDHYQALINENIDVKRKAIEHKSITVISPSRWLLDKSKTSSLFKGYKHFHVPYGLDTETFKPMGNKEARAVLGLPQDKVIYLFVADKIESFQKGLSILLEALNCLDADVVPEIHLVIAGGTITVDGIGHTALGRVHDPKLMSMIYNASDFFIIPSLEDNLPNTCLESLCCGTPVIGFPIGGVLDMITPETNGLLCEEVNSQSLARTIEKSFARSENFVSSDVSANALEKYSLKVQARKYLQIFTES